MLINLFTFFPVVIFITGGISFVSHRKHLLITLLSLEFIILRLIFFIYIYLIINYVEIYFIFIFLVFRVCEGALGLSILVLIIRTHGNNYFQSFNSLIC